MPRLSIWLAALVLTGITVIASTSRPCSATTMAEALRQDMLESVRYMNEAKTVLTSKDNANWSDAEVETYLSRALYAVYYANCIYIDENKQLPYDSEALRSSGILSDWPGNPFDTWEPMTWTEGGTEFKPGGLVLQPCPPNLYSGILKPVARTHVLSIFGPSSDYQPISPVDKLFDWAIVPPGTAFLTGAKFQTTEETIKRREAQKKLAEESKAQQENSNTQPKGDKDV